MGDGLQIAPIDEGRLKMQKSNEEIVTPETLKKFSRDVSAGKWQGREAEAEKEGERLIEALLKQMRKK